MTRTLKGRRYDFVIEAEPQEDELVQPKWECPQCPQCHERRMDYLEAEDGVIRCATCGTVYEL